STGWACRRGPTARSSASRGRSPTSRGRAPSAPITWPRPSSSASRSSADAPGGRRSSARAGWRHAPGALRGGGAARGTDRCVRGSPETSVLADPVLGVAEAELLAPLGAAAVAVVGGDAALADERAEAAELAGLAVAALIAGARHALAV